MAPTIEYQAVTEATRLANREVNAKAVEAGQAARAKIEAEWTALEKQGVYNPEKRAEILDKADRAYAAEVERVTSQEWQRSYDKHLETLFKALHAGLTGRADAARVPQGESVTYGGELTPNSEKRF